MKLSIVVLFSFLVVSTKAVTLIGTALSAFSPCENGVLNMEYQSGKPPSLDNYFDGYLYLGHINQTLSEYVIQLVFVSPINGVSILDGGEGRVDRSEDKYLITFTPNEEARRLKFRVQGKKGEVFPDLISLHINGVDSCPQPRQWRRRPTGGRNTAYSDDFNSAEEAKTDEN